MSETPLRILHVEDSSADAELAHHELRKGGLVFECQRVETREAFLAALADFAPDVILSDYRLPEFDGMEALLLAQEHAPDVPVIITTGTVNEETAVACMKAGAADYVLKDALGRLPTALRGALEKRRLELERQRAEARIRQLNRLLRTISEINQAIVRADDREELQSKACRVLVEHGGFLLAWVGFADAASGLVVPAAWAGERSDYLEGIEVRFDDSPEGRGPVGTAIRTGEHAIIGDVETDPSAVPWREEMLARGYRTLAAFPVRIHGTVTGALTVYASKAIDFGDEEAKLLDELAGDLGYALEALENRDRRAQAEDALAKSELYYRSLIEHSLDLTLVLDPGGQMRYISPSVFRVLGYTPRDLDGMNFLQLVHPEDLAETGEKLRSALGPGAPVESVETRIRHQDGSWRTFVASGKLFPSEAGLPGVIVNARDVTERKQLENQLSQAQKMEAVGRLAGGVAHDFNNLLTAILGYSELMEAQLPDDEDLRSSLREIHHAGERAAVLTRQLLAFSRRQVLQPRVLDLNAVISEVEKLLRRLIGEDVKLVTRFDSEPGTVKADSGQLEQVLMNLAVNARDAMPEGGTLTIETTDEVLDAGFAAGHPGARPGEYVVLTVADTGIGMSDEVQALAFEPFFTTKGRDKGTGLGLSTVYGVVKQSDGYISLESEPGRGTTLRIYLPRAAGVPEDSGIREPPSRSSRGKETILVVEDEAGVRRLTHAILEAQGYSVLEAESGEMALEVARSHAGAIHLVVTDVIMPGINGRLFWDRLRVQRPSTRVLFTSGYAQDTITTGGNLEPGFAFLPKPFSPSSLLQKVRDVLGGSGESPGLPGAPGADLPSD